MTCDELEIGCFMQQHEPSNLTKGGDEGTDSLSLRDNPRVPSPQLLVTEMVRLSLWPVSPVCAGGLCPLGSRFLGEGANGCTGRGDLSPVLSLFIAR